MRFKRLRVQVLPFALVVTGLAALARPGMATTPFPSSVLDKTNGVWKSPRGEFTGAWLFLRDNDLKTTRRLDIRDLFPDKQYDLYVHDTTAGPFWGHYAVPLVVKLAEHDYLCVSFWSGKRLLVNLDTGVCEDSARFDRELTGAENARIRELLATAAKDLPTGKVGTYGSELEGAMLLAARHRMKQTKADLDAINQYATWSGPMCPYQQRGFSEGLDRTLRDRGRFYDELELRQIAQLALRRLGYCPKGYPVFLFEKEKKSVAVDLDKRRQKSSDLEVGWTSQQVYNLMGSPDFMEYATAQAKGDSGARTSKLWDDAWRYDFTGKDDFSLLVIWDDKGRVDRIKRITPALWHGDALFSDEIEKPVFRYDGRLDGGLLQSKEFRGKVEDRGARTLVFQVRAERPVEHLGHSSATSPTSIWYHPAWYDGCFGRRLDTGEQFVVFWCNNAVKDCPFTLDAGKTYTIEYRGELEDEIMGYKVKCLDVGNIRKVTRK